MSGPARQNDSELSRGEAIVAGVAIGKNDPVRVTPGAPTSIPHSSPLP